MTISRVELNGQIALSQDYTNIKHHEDASPMIQQNTIAKQNDKAVEAKLQHVNDSENAQNRQKKFDASEEGSNHYYGDGGQSRKNNKNLDGRVVVKGKQQGFDLKI